jgi:cytochrome c oxidase assembly protein subunit 11
LGEQQVPGAVGASKRNTQVDLSRSITVEFDANARGPWDFKSDVRSVRVHPGEVTTVVYEFRNRQDHAMSAQAIPSYAPKQATAHFTKLECFCFTEHRLQAGESKRWPVVFVIDPKLPNDVKTITLSYTFFEVGGKVPVAPGGSV